MDGGGYPDGIGQITDPWFAGDYGQAVETYFRWLPLTNHENRQRGPATAKTLMKPGGVIACDTVWHLITPLHPEARAGLLDIAPA